MTLRQRPSPGHRLSAVLLALLTVGALSAVAPARAADGHGDPPPPETGFEQRNGASWTTLEEETRFLREVDRRSKRVRIEQVGSSVQNRPLRLVSVGVPTPRRAAAEDKVALFVCSQHGNEPAGRETCLHWIRELAFSATPATEALLRTWTLLFIPTANPDGRAADTRENAQGVDVNRDHLTLLSPEARAVARTVERWQPDLVLDLHEIPSDDPRVNRVIFDDDVYYLWPRNLNVDQQLYTLAKTLAQDFIGPGARDAGYSADEYGEFAVADQVVFQFAGDHDEGISRNLAGLRGAVSVLIESNATANPTRPEELVSQAAVNRRRVASQIQNVQDTLRFLDVEGGLVGRASAGALKRYAEQGRQQDTPVYFGGADNDEPEPNEVLFPPPCAYRITPDQAALIAHKLDLLDISVRPSGSSVLVPLAQPSEPLIPLLLDQRGARNIERGTPVQSC